MKAPDFSLKDQDGVTRSLKDFTGRWVVLYFYPKDDTPSCTTEACSFRDERDVIAELTGASVIGISMDTVESHRAFANKYNLNFTLLSDPDRTVIDAYGAWGKKMFGREGILRQTFIINPAGEVVKKYGRVRSVGHGSQVINDLKALGASK